MTVSKKLSNWFAGCAFSSGKLSLLCKVSLYPYCILCVVTTIIVFRLDPTLALPRYDDLTSKFDDLFELGYNKGDVKVSTSTVVRHSDKSRSYNNDGHVLSSEQIVKYSHNGWNVKTAFSNNVTKEEVTYEDKVSGITLGSNLKSNSATNDSTEWEASGEMKEPSRTMHFEVHTGNDTISATGSSIVNTKGFIFGSKVTHNINEGGVENDKSSIAIGYTSDDESSLILSEVHLDGKVTGTLYQELNDKLAFGIKSEGNSMNEHEDGEGETRVAGKYILVPDTLTVYAKINSKREIGIGWEIPVPLIKGAPTLFLSTEINLNDPSVRTHKFGVGVNVDKNHQG